MYMLVLSLAATSLRLAGQAGACNQPGGEGLVARLASTVHHSFVPRPSYGGVICSVVQIAELKSKLERKTPKQRAFDPAEATRLELNIH